MSLQKNVIYQSIESFLQKFDGIVNLFSENAIHPIFSEDINTACVTFDSRYSTKCSSFLINENFWNKLNYNEKVFVFIHETLHILLKHNKRVHEYFDTISSEKISYDIMGRATDICINHIIIEKYLNNIPMAALPTLRNMACFVDTVFKPEDSPLIPKNMSFIYYYEKYIELYGMEKPNIENFDNHPKPSDMNHDEKIDNNLNSELLESMFDQLINSMDIEETENGIKIKTKKYSTKNTIPDEIENVLVENKKSLTEHFRLVINSFESKKRQETSSYNWYGHNRRTSIAMQSINPELNIPVLNKKNQEEKQHRICIYLDVSGSCADYSLKFMELTANLPKNYSVDLYVFADIVCDVRVTNVNNNKKFDYSNAGYGTNISNVLSSYKSISLEKRYDAVFVLTDGDYKNIRNDTQFDYSKWFFFMTPDYSNNVPTQSKIFELRNI